MGLRVQEAESPDDWAVAGRLMREYLDGLPFVVDFQDVDSELDDLVVAYPAPRSLVLLARLDGGRPVGVVGVMEYPAGGPGAVELKRMYVAPEARGTGAGRALAVEAIARARALGYTRMLLDTVASLTPAIALYESLGFVAIDAYRHNPRPDARYFALAL